MEQTKAQMKIENQDDEIKTLRRQLKEQIRDKHRILQEYEIALKEARSKK